MQIFDASSMIYAWDNYPCQQFPGLWEWIAARIAEQSIAMASVAFEEVGHKSTECTAWLSNHHLKLLPVSNAIIKEAFRIKGLLGIHDDKYHPKGVDENDIFIIATACIHGTCLVSDEAIQTLLVENPTKRKIPAVCAMPAVAMTCMKFIDYLRLSGAVFR